MDTKLYSVRSECMCVYVHSFSPQNTYFLLICFGICHALNMYKLACYSDMQISMFWLMRPRRQRKVVVKMLSEKFKTHLMLVNCEADFFWIAAWSFTHWGQVTHICVSKLAIIGSDDGFSPGRRRAIFWTSTDLLLIGILETIWMEFKSKCINFHWRSALLCFAS